MNIQSPEKSVVVRTSVDLVVGSAYMVKGTSLTIDKDKYGNVTQPESFTRKPIPPQMIVVLSPPVNNLCAVHFFCDDGVAPFDYKTILPLEDVNVPEHGQHDRYLEKIPDTTVAAAMRKMEEKNREQNYMEMSMDKQTWAEKEWKK